MRDGVAPGEGRVTLTLPPSILTSTPRRHVLGELALRPLDANRAVLERHRDPLGDHDGALADARLDLPRPASSRWSSASPDLAEQLAADLLPARFFVAHHAARRGEDGDAHAREDARDVVVTDVDAAARAETRLMPSMALSRSRPYLRTMVRLRGSPSLSRTSAMKPSDLRISAMCFFSRLAGTRCARGGPWPRCGCASACRRRDRSSWHHQLALITPGISPFSAKSREADTAELELAVVAARAPHTLQRLRRRVENFGVRLSFAN